MISSGSLAVPVLDAYLGISSLWFIEESIYIYVHSIPKVAAAAWTIARSVMITQLDVGVSWYGICTS